MKFCGRSKGRERAAGGNGSTRMLRSQEPTTRRRQSGVGAACGTTHASGANSGPDPQQRPQTASSRTTGKCTKDAPPESDASAPSRDDINNAGSPPGLGSNEDGSRRYIEADGRVACSNCLRRFSPDRVGVHQDICKRVNEAVVSRDDGDRTKCERRKTLKTSKPQSAFYRRGSNHPVLGEFGAATRTHGALRKSEDQEKHNFVDPHLVSSAENGTVRTIDDREV